MNTLAQLLTHLAAVTDADKDAPPLAELAGQLERTGATLLLGVRPHTHRFPADAAATCVCPGADGRGLYAWLEFERPAPSAPVVVLPLPSVLEVAA